MADAIAEYKYRFDLSKKQIELIQKRIKRISNIRFGLFIVVSIGAVLLYRSNEYVFLTIEVLSGCVAFAAAVLWHNELYRKRDRLKNVMKINEMGLKRCSGEWGEFKDSGEEFVNHDHAFSWDLDLYGKHSVYQWLCTCHTFYGRTFFAKSLQEQIIDVDYVLKKQTAIQELSGLLDWRQEFEVYGLTAKSGDNPEPFLKWSEKATRTFKHISSSFLLRIFPYLSLIVGTVGLLLNGTLLFFALMYSIQLMIWGLTYTKTANSIRAFEKNGSLLLSYSHLIEAIENRKFSSELLENRKKDLITGKNVKASEVLRNISKVINAAEVRSSAMALLLANAVWLWDARCAIKADKIKHQYGLCFRRWIEVIGTFETLASLSIVRFEHPQWAFPIISKDKSGIETRQMGHPLLKETICVRNDLDLLQGGSVAIITGSNMSGKSTFLRSIGVNIVLAYSGSPVCASYFLCSPLQIYSSMRINDDLSSKVSTFYAELLRIKKIVEAVKSDVPVLFLLDELFRGTNSQDRHDGAVAVLHALSNQKSIGIISTHDMDLCNLAERDKTKFLNYHFEEHYEDHTITFDYKIKHGPSMTRNAMFLIRMIGIKTD